MRAKLRVPNGATGQASGGETSAPSPVYLVGIFSPWPKAELVKCRGMAMVLSLGREISAIESFYKLRLAPIRQVRWPKGLTGLKNPLDLKEGPRRRASRHVNPRASHCLVPPGARPPLEEHID